MKSYIFKILDIFLYQITYWRVEPPQFVEVSHSLIQSEFDGECILYKFILIFVI